MTHNRNSKPVQLSRSEAELLDMVRQGMAYDTFTKLELTSYSGATIRTLVDRGLLVAGKNAETASSAPRQQWVQDFIRNGSGFVRLSNRAASRPWKELQ